MKEVAIIRWTRYAIHTILQIVPRRTLQVEIVKVWKEKPSQQAGW